MWSQVILFILVGLACASNNPGWKDNTEYVYSVRGRTLASLHEVTDEFTGILLKGLLTVQTRSNGLLRAKLSDAQYAEIHTQLPKGWNQHIEDSSVSYQPLPISSRPFEIVMSNGVVRDLIVDQEVTEWEANIIKSIVSQMQLDTKGDNLIKSRMNSGHSQESNNAVFKTLEDTVTGITETLYDIHPLPEYILQSKPWLAPFPHLKGDGQVIEIVKNKNFTQNKNLPSYYFGLSGFGQWEPATNQLGEALTRTSTGHAVITGTLNRFTVQHSMTVNKIIINPTFYSNQRGSVVSSLNLTLTNAEQQNNQFDELSQPIHLGNLVYNYKQAASRTNKVGPGQRFQRNQYYDSSESRSLSEEGEPAEANNVSPVERNRLPRSIRTPSNKRYQSEDSFSSVSSEEEWLVEKPKLNKAPESPFLPLIMGYKGQSVKLSENINLVQLTQKMAEHIGQDLQQSDLITQKTLERYVMLTSYLRVMNEDELKQAASVLYNNEPRSAKRSSWVAFRDAVAEVGTGPAFLTIKKLIESEKIKHEEAAQILQSMTQSLRQPTEELIRNYYRLITSPRVMDQHALNETAVLSFTNLVREVFVDKHISHREYPVHSFGRFDTRAGNVFVEKELIPYFTKQLHEAISKADARKTHLYIRALGNVGHRQILAAFKPYLEGEKQCSQFQRLLMVVAMGKLVKVEPKVARAVLYRLYQNAAEVQEVRIAAVYQLMHTNPPTDMLQRMADFTNEDVRENVNAAVKSAIESASELEGVEFSTLRSSAAAARPLLTKKSYGLQYSREYLRSYATNEMSTYIKQTVQSVASEDSGLPNAFRYVLKSNLNGFSSELFEVEGLISSIDELIDLFSKQTEEYKKSQQTQQKSQQSEKSSWSSEKIAGILNLQSQEREQLEGSTYLNLGDFHKFMSFDNHSIDQLSEWVRSAEESLKNGISVDYLKFVNQGEMAVAFPTETGLPFIYTYDMPIMFKMQGRVQGESKPQLTTGNKIVKPDSIKLDTEMRFAVSAKVQTDFGFITPFDHKHYSAGYDKNVQIHIPIRTKIIIDLKNQQAQTELEPLEPEKNSQLFHYSSWPYTTKYDILSWQPVSERKSTHIIKKSQQLKIDQILGQKSTGMAFRMKFSTEKQMADMYDIVEKLLAQGDSPIEELLFENVENTEIDFQYSGAHSSNRKLAVRVEYKEERESGDESNIISAELSDLAIILSGSKDRKQAMLRKSAAGFKHARAHAVDASVEFQGQRNVQIFATLGVAKSNADPKSRILFYLKQKNNQPSGKTFEVALSANSRFPNSNDLDMTYALKFDPTSTSQVQLLFGEDLRSGSKIEANVQLLRSDSRLQYLHQHPMYRQCKLEMEEGNNQLHGCAHMTELANLLDHFKVHATHTNMDYKTLNLTYKIYSAIRYLTFLNFDENVMEGNGKSNQLDLEARFAPDFRAVNISLDTQEFSAKISDLRVEQWLEPFVTIHPVFHVTSRVLGRVQQLRTFRPICVVDKSAVNTLDNKTYSLDLSNVWTVMLQYLPKRAHQNPISVQQQLKEQLENHVILIRESVEGSDLKQVKIVVAVPETQGRVWEIELLPSVKGTYPKVLINGEQVALSQTQVHDVLHGLIQVYGLPNGEVKVEVRDAYYVIFDGLRSKLVILSPKFRNSVRGLCGTFTGESTTDFLTPRDYIVRDSREFIASYAVLEEGQQNQEIMDLKNRAHKSHNFYKRLPQYTNVISGADIESGKPHHGEHSSDTCSKLQTRYSHKDGFICFTVKPMAVCRSGCQQQGNVTKNIAVHCVEENSASTLWKNQIDKGASPNFTSKEETHKIRMTLPRSCSK